MLDTVGEQGCRSEACCGVDEVGNGFGSAVWWPRDDGCDGRGVRDRDDGVIVA